MIGVRGVSIYQHMRLCDECLAEYSRIGNEYAKTQEMANADVLPVEEIENGIAALEEQIGIPPTTDENGYIGVPDPEIPENAVSPEASTDEEMNNIPFDEEPIDPEIPEKMQFFKLRAYAKSKGVDIERYKTKPEMLEELEKLGV
jgi:hypothetical protein